MKKSLKKLFFMNSGFFSKEWLRSGYLMVNMKTSSFEQKCVEGRDEDKIAERYLPDLIADCLLQIVGS